VVYMCIYCTYVYIFQAYMCVPYGYVAGRSVSGRLVVLRENVRVFLPVDGDAESDGRVRRVSEHGRRAGQLLQPGRDGLRNQLVVSTDIISNQPTLFETNKQ